MSSCLVQTSRNVNQYRHISQPIVSLVAIANTGIRAKGSRGRQKQQEKGANDGEERGSFAL